MLFVARFAATNTIFLFWCLFAPMTAKIVEKLRAAVRDVPDFPKTGIVFKDITPILSDPLLFRASIDSEKHMHSDSVRALCRVVLVYDLLATGGRSAAAAVLIRKAGGHLLEAQFLIELEFLRGRKQLEPTPVTSFLKY